MNKVLILGAGLICRPIVRYLLELGMSRYSGNADYDQSRRNDCGTPQRQSRGSGRNRTGRANPPGRVDPGHGRGCICLLTATIRWSPSSASGIERTC